MCNLTHKFCGVTFLLHRVVNLIKMCRRIVSEKINR